MEMEEMRGRQWLHRFVGRWIFEGERLGEDDVELERFSGTEDVRTLDGVWFVADAVSSVTGGSGAKSLLVLGYDSRQGRYVGTWIDSLRSQLWICAGSIDPGERVMTLGSESVADDGSTVRYTHTFEFRSNDHRVLTTRRVDLEGASRPTTVVQYRRTNW